MAHGKVKWFNSNKGFGFIEQTEGPDLFVHYTEIKDEGFKRLAEGDEVEFDVAQGPKGGNATNVRVTTRSEAQPDDQPQPRRTSRPYNTPRGDSKPSGRSIDDLLKALRKSSKENQQDLANRLKRR